MQAPVWDWDSLGHWGHVRAGFVERPIYSLLLTPASRCAGSPASTFSHVSPAIGSRTGRLNFRMRALVSSFLRGKCPLPRGSLQKLRGEDACGSGAWPASRIQSLAILRAGLGRAAVACVGGIPRATSLSSRVCSGGCGLWLRPFHFSFFLPYLLYLAGRSFFL